MNEATRSVAYAPSPVPTKVEAMPGFFTGELERIAQALKALASGRIEMTYVAPDKPREGDIRLADGTSWNPGGGAGVYAWYAAAWHKLG
jgi:hypothetical protein